MDPLVSLISLFLSIVLVVKLFSAFLHSQNPTNLPPSPPSLPILGHLHLVLSKPLHLTFSHLASLHGPLLLLRFASRRVLLVSSFSLAHQCFTTHDLTFATRPQLPTDLRLTYNHTTLGTAPYGPHWRNIRRIVAVHVFSPARLFSSADARGSETRALLHRLAAVQGRVDLRASLQGAVANVMMMAVAGRRCDEGEVKWLEEMVEETFAMSGMENARDFLWMLRVVDWERVEEKVRRLEKEWDEYLHGLIEQVRRGHQERTKTLIGALLAVEDEDPEYCTDGIIKAQALSMLSAGTHTTTGTIEWAMSILLNHPEALQKVQDELDASIGQTRLVQESDLPNLSYLHAVVLETLRLFPTAPLLLPHESTADCTVGGFHVPGGTILVANAYAMHRDPQIWEDALQFKPERFLSDAGDAAARMMLPFGLGRRRCPGEGLAMRLVELVLGALLQCFEWGRVGQEGVVDMEGGSGLDMRKARKLEAMCRPRQATINLLS